MLHFFVARINVTPAEVFKSKQIGMHNLKTFVFLVMKEVDVLKRTVPNSPGKKTVIFETELEVFGQCTCQ